MFACIGPSALNFRGNDITQYGITNGSPQALESITACFWMSAPEAYVNDHVPVLLSYSTTGKNDFLLLLWPHLHMMLLENSYRYDF